MWYYLSVFVAAFLVDLLPFFGPPAWTVMVYFQMRFELNIWFVLISGVLGSALGRYVLFLYILNSLNFNFFDRHKAIKKVIISLGKFQFFYFNQFHFL